MDLNRTSPSPRSQGVERDARAQKGLPPSGPSPAELPITDIEAAHEFYAGKLGFELLSRSGVDSPGWARYGFAGREFHLRVFKEWPCPESGPPRLTFQLPNRAFDGVIDRLGELSIPFVIDTEQRAELGRSARVAYCRDPDGNLIEFTDV